jgi:hypothetical protein
LGTAKDEQYAREKQASDEKVAALTAEAENAKKERARADLKIEEAKERASKADELAGAANERAGVLEIQAQDLTRQNLTIRSGVANLEKEASEAKTRYLELLERVSPRSLSSQRARLLDMLKQFAKGPITISCLNGNAESCGFAQEIADLLKDAGWTVEGPRDMVLFGSNGQPPRGLFLTIKDGRNPPPQANVLIQLLNSSGFLTQGEQNPRLEEGKLNLLVGVKP